MIISFKLQHLRATTDGNDVPEPNFIKYLLNLFYKTLNE